jgi:integrase
MSGKLRPSDVASLGDGMHGDGEYLFLRVRGSARSWIVRRSVDGKKVDLGLGSVDRVSLALARKERDKLIEQWRNGKDPAVERRAEREAKANRRTFAEVARLKIAAKQSGWRTSFEGMAHSLDAWTKSMEVDCALITNKAIDEIGVDDIKRVVSPHWDKNHHKTARDLISRIGQVFDYAIAHGWRSTANPAGWSVFKHLSPAAPAKQHHAALPWQDVPRFLRQLRASPSIGVDVVELAILTATRSGETRGAKWSEIDWTARTWTIPAARMKMGKKRPDPHVVPLSDQAIALLKRVKAEGVEGVYIFPGYAGGGGYRRQRAASPIPNASVWRLVKRLGGDAVTTHGFRSTFRDWCGEHGLDRELAERSLAHQFGSEVENAYARSRLVDRRAPLMQQWADYCCGDAPAVVVPFKRSA